MTTIILTIIGILLAAAAALMVIFYGGDAFNAGSVGAQANTYQNAGTNVISAVQLAKADGSSWTDLASLHNPTDESKDYLKEVPALNEASAVVLTDTVSATPAAVNGGEIFAAVVGGDKAEEVCVRINRNLKLATPDAVVYDDGIKMGCDTTNQVFFAH